MRKPSKSRIEEYEKENRRADAWQFNKTELAAALRRARKFLYREARGRLGKHAQLWQMEPPTHSAALDLLRAARFVEAMKQHPLAGVAPNAN